MTHPLRPENFYHTGVVVPDLSAAAERLTAAAGYTWTTPIKGPVTIRTVSGTQTVEMQFVYSLQAPHLELIEAVPGTPWTTAKDNAVHHLGYFTDDFGATVDALQELGYALEMCHTTDGEAPSVFAYFRSPEDVRIEIVDRTVFGDLDAFLKAFQ
ncbi:VOC family protein [Mycobacterium sp. NPDC051804]|uniref:VOC family protein n=1 Tax=Mycobacterium sp. NPDC051804 TaxID=3364295 RepID=UPI00379CE8C5